MPDFGRIKLKILALFTLLTSAALVAVVFFTVPLAEKDKLEFAESSLQAQSVQLSAFAEIQIRLFVRELQSIARGLNLKERRFNEEAQNLFQAAGLIQFISVRERDAVGEFQNVESLTKMENPPEETLIVEAAQRADKGLSLQAPWPNEAERFLLSFTESLAGSLEPLNIVAILDGENLPGLFVAHKNEWKFLIDGAGQSVLSAQDAPLKGSAIKAMLGEEFQKNQPHGSRVKEIRLKGGKSLLISQSPVGIGELTVVVMSLKDQILQTYAVLFWKSLFFSAAIVCLILLVATYALNYWGLNGSSGGGEGIGNPNAKTDSEKAD